MEHIVEKKPYSEYVKMSEEALEKVNNFVEEAKEYTDSVKNDLLNGAGDAYDTLKELGDLIENNVDSIEALREIASGKADKVHSHVASNITDLQEKLNSTKNDAVSSAKTYTDTKITESEAKTNQTLANKLDKTTEANKVCGTDKNGNQTNYTVNSNIVADAIPRRTWDGNLYVPEKTGNYSYAATSRKFVEGLVNPISEKQNELEERVADLESLTLTFTEDKATATEKSVPANVGKYALVKSIGGASKKVAIGKNLINPAELEFEVSDTDFGNWCTHTLNADGTITYTVKAYGCPVYIPIDSAFPAGRYYAYIEGANSWGFDGVMLEIDCSSDYSVELDDYIETTRTLKVMIWRDETVTTDEWEVVEAPEGTVFEPYEEGIVNANVERIESIGANLFDGSLISTGKLNGVTLTYDKETQIFTLNGEATSGGSLGSTFLNLKLGTGNYLIKTEVVGGKVTVPSGKYAVAYFGASDTPNVSSNWQSATLKSVGGTKTATLLYEYVTNFRFHIDQGVQLDNLQVRVMLARVGSEIPYKPYYSEPIDTFVIPEEVKNKDGYGREGSYIKYEDGVWSLTVTKDENLEILAEPVVTDITSLVTDDNKIKVEGGGALRLVSNNDLTVPSTVQYVTRKG